MVRLEVGNHSDLGSNPNSTQRSFAQKISFLRYYIIITSLLLIITISLLHIITSLLHHYYTIITSLLRPYYIIITHYYNCIIVYYYPIAPFLHHFFVIITAFIHHFYKIIIISLLRYHYLVITSLLHRYYFIFTTSLFHHYYIIITSLLHYSLLLRVWDRDAHFYVSNLGYSKNIPNQKYWVGDKYGVSLAAHQWGGLDAIRCFRALPSESRAESDSCRIFGQQCPEDSRPFVIPFTAAQGPEIEPAAFRFDCGSRLGWSDSVGAASAQCQPPRAALLAYSTYWWQDHENGFSPQDPLRHKQPDRMAIPGSPPGNRMSPGDSERGKEFPRRWAADRFKTMIQGGDKGVWRVLDSIVMGASVSMAQWTASVASGRRRLRFGWSFGSAVSQEATRTRRRPRQSPYPAAGHQPFTLEVIDRQLGLAGS